MGQNELIHRSASGTNYSAIHSDNNKTGIYLSACFISYLSARPSVLSHSASLLIFVSPAGLISSWPARLSFYSWQSTRLFILICLIYLSICFPASLHACLLVTSSTLNLSLFTWWVGLISSRPSCLSVCSWKSTCLLIFICLSLLVDLPTSYSKCLSISPWQLLIFVSLKSTCLLVGSAWFPLGLRAYLSVGPW